MAPRERDRKAGVCASHHTGGPPRLRRLLQLRDRAAEQVRAQRRCTARTELARAVAMAPHEIAVGVQLRADAMVLLVQEHAVATVVLVPTALRSDGGVASPHLLEPKRFHLLGRALQKRNAAPEVA